ncbi:MAG TPA: PRC-barrel domain-containing protein [Thermomicrobiales bacterium]|nr:PRC-barrel domain-containing protein [Thermomicrobiales bacterium]
MQARTVEIGQDVVSSDGQKIGTLDRLVLNTENNHVENLVVDHGILSHDKLIDIDLIARTEPDRIILSLTKDEADELPDFVKEEYSLAPPDIEIADPYIAPAMAGGRMLYGAATMAPSYPNPGPSLFEQAPVNPPPVETVSNIPVQDIMISDGTDVVGSDGKKVGAVDEVLFAPNGDLEGFVVKAGFLFKHDVRVPMDWVADTGHDKIRLKITSDEAEHQAGAKRR